MISGVTFDGEHCFDDFGMILAQKEIGEPEVQTYYVEVPGKNGMLDLTESLTGDVRYRSRTLTLTFVSNEYISGENWATFLSAVARVLHGRQKTIVFDDDPHYYFRGRCEVDSFTTSWEKQTIVITCTCEPFKYIESAAEHAWLWDPFSFTEGAIYHDALEVKDGRIVLDFMNLDASVVPSFTCSNAMTFEINGETFEMPAGQSVNYDISFDANTEIKMIVTGTGTFTMDYEGGVL